MINLKIRRSEQPNKRDEWPKKPAEMRKFGAPDPKEASFQQAERPAEKASSRAWEAAGGVFFSWIFFWCRSTAMLVCFVNCSVPNSIVRF
jgi:hypothetical protein